MLEETKEELKKGEGTLDASDKYTPTDANSKFNKKTAKIKKRSEDNLSDDVTNPCYKMEPGTIIGQGSNQITCP